MNSSQEEVAPRAAITVANVSKVDNSKELTDKAEIDDTYTDLKDGDVQKSSPC